MTVLEAIAPELVGTDNIRASMNHERWFKVVNNVLNVPPDNVLRGNFALMDNYIEAIHNYQAGEPSVGWWNDNLIDGVTYTDVCSCIEAINFLKTQEVLAVDIESRNLGYDGNKVLLIGFAYDDYKSIVIANFEKKILENLQTLFDKKDIKFIWHNGKFDTTRLSYLLGINARIDEDTMLQHYACINERKSTHGLKELGPLYLGTPAWDDELDNYKRKWCLQHRVKVSDFQYDMIPSKILLPYLYRDCCATFQLNKRFKILARSNSEQVYARLIRAANVFKDIEVQGALIDMNYIYELQDELDTKIYEAEKHVQATAREIWDPIQYAKDTGAKTYEKIFSHKSPKQLKWMLEQLVGPIASTRAEVLEKLAEDHPDIEFIEAIMDLRKYNKYMDTYVMGLQELVCKDGRLRCTYNLHGTETGRLSCSDPNLQNIPRDKLIKNLFKSSANKVLVQFDYSQAELRVLAYLSQDEYLRETYRDGKDLHDAMALKIFGPNFNKEQRVAAKTVNFGIPYGRGPGSMHAKLGMTLAEATKLIKDWYAAAPGAKKWVDEMRKRPYKKGEPYTTIFGRQRHYIITMDNRNHIENEAVNFPIQSVASDLTMTSLCEISDWIKSSGLSDRCIIVNTVHDSIVLECDNDADLLEQVVKVGVGIMSSVPKKYLTNPVLDFPFVADAEIGYKWGGLKDAAEYIEALRSVTKH
jgi:DNA polymerase I-like protein with 3'-5' exonuclease and polymerase domains